MKKDTKHENEGKRIMNKEEVKELFEVLKFYADEETHRVFVDSKGFITTKAIKDNGERAREALSLLK